MRRSGSANHFHITALLLSLLASVMFLVIACNAPRDNVLDPNSPYYGGFDPQGRNDDTKFVGFRITTHHFENDLSTGPYDLIRVSISIADDNLIEDVQLEIENGFRFKMERTDSLNSNATGTYGYTFNPGDYGHSVADFASVKFYVFCYDRKGYVSRSKDETYVRVLTHIPVLVYPGPPDSEGDLATVGTRPRFEWTQDASRFDLTYDITVWPYLEDQNSANARRFGGIPRVFVQGDTLTDSVILPGALLPDTENGYRVVIRTTDEFGNQTTGPVRDFYVGFD